MIRRFLVTEIEFDFEMGDDEYPSFAYQQDVIESAVGQVYEIEVEEYCDDDVYINDLVLDEITNHTGWCILFCNYDEVFS